MIQIPGTAPLPHDIWETILDYDTPQAIAGVVPLLVFTSYGTFFRSFAIHGYNADPTTTIQLFVDVSHGGTVANEDYGQMVEIEALTEGSIFLPPPNPFAYLRIYGKTPGASANLQWALLGMRR